ncbi:MAG: metalloregulator ArsR/SmtB family transcription factor [PS1 clade bacterium]|jgi:DNA-binding transcriptional ArsR family regulator
MNDDKMIQILSELGNLTRLSIYRLLIKNGDDGLRVGEIAERLSIPASTLSFHLGCLTDAGLVVQRKISRSVICSAKLDQLTEVIIKLQKECCADVDNS